MLTCVMLNIVVLHRLRRVAGRDPRLTGHPPPGSYWTWYGNGYIISWGWPWATIPVVFKPNFEFLLYRNFSLKPATHNVIGSVWYPGSGTGSTKYRFHIFWLRNRLNQFYRFHFLYNKIPVLSPYVFANGTKGREKKSYKRLICVY